MKNKNSSSYQEIKDRIQKLRQPIYKRFLDWMKSEEGGEVGWLLAISLMVALLLILIVK